MPRLINSNKNLARNLLIISSFIVFAFLSVALIWDHGILYFARVDGFFHLSRTLELVKSQHIIPGYTMNSFDETGSSVITMYPYLFMYPLAWLLKILSLKHALLLFYALGVCTTAIISYFSSLSVSHRRSISYLFALIYAFSGEFLAMSFYSQVTDIGVYFSAMFLPLVIFGAVLYVEHGHWLMLSCGISLVVCSNLISVAFISVLLIIWLMINYKVLNRHKWINLAKAAGLTVIATAVIWLPIIKLSLANQLFIPTFKRPHFVDLVVMFRSALHNSFSLGCQSPSFYALLGLVVGLFFIKQNRNLRHLYIFAVLTLWLSSTWFPWRTLMRSHGIYLIMLHLQNTIRVLVVPELILEFILADCLVRFFKNNGRSMVIGLLLIALVITQFQVQHDYLTQGARLAAKGSGITSSRQILTTSEHFHNTDYWPKITLKSRHQIFRHLMSNDKQMIHFTPQNHGKFKFKTTKNIKNLQLPFLYYYGTRYRCTLDDRPVRPKANRHQLMTIDSVPKGNHWVHIQILPKISTKISLGITLIGLLLYIKGIFRRYDE